ncbi:MAG TPA: tryptophan--tRNA ligase [Pyrinomonadaceae bacterium]|nr:tryptophan--tRNA ligase [Pyrinomonadaceae bacterium]
MKKRIFSGAQPTGNLHIGNYLGALKNWVHLQNEYENFFCIVNLHAITLPQDPQTLRQKTLDLARIYLASGVDPQKSTIFIQSDVAEHAELTWILSCVARMGELERMTQFKDKSSGKGERVGVGLFTYPVLMASDILLYQTDLVPVGQDQKQHLELTRDLAERFNRDYGETFKMPEPYIPPVGAKILSLAEPEKKMSKSDENVSGSIFLLDSPEDITKKIKKAVTDSGTEIRFDESRPAINNLLTIYHLLTGKTAEETEAHFEGKGYGHFKTELAEVVVEFLRPFQERVRDFDDDELEKILKNGAEKARAVASETLQTVYERMGIR